MTLRPTIKAALLVGFGVTFGIWIFAGYYFTRRISEVERDAAAINARYTRAQELLSTVRAQVLLGSVYFRDALLDPEPTSADAYRRQIELTYHDVDEALQQYVPVLDSSIERDRVERLRREIGDFRVTMAEILASDRTNWRLEARELLRGRIVPRRELVFRVSEELQSLNRAAFVQQQGQMRSLTQATQRRIWASLGFAILGSLGVALVATLYSTRLEARIRRQQIRDAQNALDLQRLSAKVINAQEEERRTIARELHDEVGQVLTAIKVELAAAHRAFTANGGSAHLLDDVRAITDGALGTVRDLSHLLHPALLDDLGLPSAIDWYLRGFGKRYGVRVEMLHEGMDARLATETEAAAYRIVQEALTNVAKHAKASSCRVYVQRLPNSLLLTIEDDGVGFDPGAVNRPGQGGGLGLIGIRERVAELRGSMRLESAPGKGTRVTVEMPARPRPAPPPDADEAPIAAMPVAGEAHGG